MTNARIVELTAQRLSDMNRANEPFEVIGRVCPALFDGQWTYAEALDDVPSEKLYPVDNVDYSAYIGSPDRIVYLAYDGDACVGQIVLRRDWNKYAFIEDIAVARAARGHGVGSALIGAAEAWARQAGLRGLALETQDTNVWACRFYRKQGFRLGGVNTELYRALGSRDIALFWYRPFD